MAVSKSKKAPIISIVVPVYNEEENIAEFYQRITQVMKGLKKSYEVLFVNDGSKDNTLELINQLHVKDKRIIVLDLSRNFGKEIALTCGLDFARGQAVIPIDADLQDPPELIPELIEKWNEGFEVVYAMRTERKGETVMKKSTALLFYRVIGKLVKFDIPHNTGDYRLLDRVVVDALKELRETNRFMKGLFSWVGYRQTGITYSRDPRFAGQTSWNYFKLFEFAMEGITSFSEKPLKLSSFFGIFISFISMLYGVYITVNALLYGNPVDGYPSLLTIILFLGGIQLISLGLIGEYVGRIYTESKRRPLYFVKGAKGIERKLQK